MADIKEIIPHTKKWEGGLSRATSDTASQFPSPYYYRGVYGWHTNKGITYQTFKEGSKNLGYIDSLENFIFMPDEIWLKIAKNLYWDKLNLDALNSQAIAQILFSWTWASGYGWRNRVQKYLQSKNIVWDKDQIKSVSDKFNQLIKAQGERKTFDELVDQYKQFYISLNQPANIKGWLNRLEDLKSFSESFIKKNAGSIGGTILLIAGVYFAYRYFN